MQDIIDIFNAEKPRFDYKNLVLEKIETIKDSQNLKGSYLFHGTPLENIPSILKEGFIANKTHRFKSSHNGLYMSSLMCQSIYYQLKIDVANGGGYDGDEKNFTLIVSKVDLDTVPHEKVKYSQDGRNGFEYYFPETDKLIPSYLVHMRVE